MYYHIIFEKISDADYDLSLDGYCPAHAYLYDLSHVEACRIISEAQHGFCSYSGKRYDLKGYRHLSPEVRATHDMVTNHEEIQEIENKYKADPFDATMELYIYYSKQFDKANRGESIDAKTLM